MPKLNLKTWMTCITLVVIALAIFAPSLTETWGSGLSIALILILGIPHGATDHILFRFVNKDFDKGWILRFFARYFLLMGLLSMIWWLLPVLALAIFLAISAYHFGQSQWHQMKAKNSIIYLIWGGFILAAPLLWNYEETAPIIEALIGKNISLSIDYQLFIPITLGALAFFGIAIFYFKKQISQKEFIQETAILILLSVLFYTTTLLVGFAVYFVFWHSVRSMQDQVIQLKNIYPNYNSKKYFRQIIPFTLVAFASLGVFAFYSPAALMSDAWISQFFMLISIVTLPHSLLMDAFLEEKIPDKQTKQKIPKQRKQQFSSEHVQVI